MKKTKILFLLSIIGILFLLILMKTTEKPITTGKIEKINPQKNKISIFLKNNPPEIVLFTDKVVELKQEQEIEIYGRQEKYKNKLQIIADKIVLRNA